eukprot:6464907-Amphidinium_carterae.3
MATTVTSDHHMVVAEFTLAKKRSRAAPKPKPINKFLTEEHKLAFSLRPYACTLDRFLNEMLLTPPTCTSTSCSRSFRTFSQRLLPRVPAPRRSHGYRMKHGHG